jgi:hypothetical protein
MAHFIVLLNKFIEGLLTEEELAIMYQLLILVLIELNVMGFHPPLEFLHQFPVLLSVHSPSLVLCWCTSSLNPHMHCV